MTLEIGDVSTRIGGSPRRLVSDTEEELDAHAFESVGGGNLAFLNGKVDTGDTISYNFAVSNLGNVTLTNVAVTDPKIPNITCLATSLAPGVSTTCTSAAAYVLTLANMNAGSVSNQALASGTPPTGPAVTDKSDPITSGPTSDNPTVSALTQTPVIGLVKTSKLNDVNNNSVTDLGDTITYSFVVSNLGTVSLANVGVTDPKVSGITCPLNCATSAFSVAVVRSYGNAESLMRMSRVIIAMNPRAALSSCPRCWPSR